MLAEQDLIRAEHSCVQLEPIRKENVMLLERLNSLLFPVQYSPEFYNSVVYHYGQDLSAMCLSDGQIVGAICCRREELHSGKVLPLQSNQICYVYVMTLGVMPNYRRRGIASVLLRKIYTVCESDSAIFAMRLHVHVHNKAALGFYERAGFQVECLAKDYYVKNSDIVPPDAYLLSRPCLSTRTPPAAYALQSKVSSPLYY